MQGVAKTINGGKETNWVLVAFPRHLISAPQPHPRSHDSLGAGVMWPAQSVWSDLHAEAAEAVSEKRNEAFPHPAGCLT